jgi:hypothetical protein
LTLFDAVTSLVVAAVIGVAGLPTPGFGLRGRLLLRVAVLRTADRDARIDERRFVISDELDDLRLGHAALGQLVGEHPRDRGRTRGARLLSVAALAALDD